MGKSARPKVQRSTKSPRKAPVEKPSTDVARQYARILGERGVDQRLSDVVRACLRAIARRLPLGSRVQREAEVFLERVIRLGELGALDLIGSPRAIAGHIAAVLGEEPLEARTVYRVLSALVEHTALVEHPTRQVWALRLSGLSDPSSPLHRTLLAETPSPYHLSERPDESASAPKELHRPDPVAALRAELVDLRRALNDERRRLSRVETELAELRERLSTRETTSEPEDVAEDRPADSRDEPVPMAPVVPSEPVSEQGGDAAIGSIEEAAPIVDSHAATPSSSSEIGGNAEEGEGDERPSGGDEGEDDDIDDSSQTVQGEARASVEPPTGRRRRKRRRGRGGPAPGR